MGWWRTFLDSLDSDGGTRFILIGVLIGGFAMLRFDWANMKAGEIITGAFGALLAVLKMSGSNREQSGTTTTATTTQQVEPVP